MGLKFLDLFAGIGGFRLGLEMAGHECVGFVEIDKFARQSYEAIHDTEGEWKWDDVSTIDYRDIPRADIWTFGFPCQDISVAGNQKGFSGNRSSLFFQVTKRLRQTKEWRTDRLPSYLLIENVKNFLSVNDGWDFLAAQIELDEIGYDLEWDVLNSKDFGVPQNRERVFIIGHLRGRCTRKVFPVGRANTEAFIKDINPKNIVLQKTHGATTTVHYDETGTLQAARLDKIPCIVDRGELKLQQETTNCVDANYHKGLDNHGQRTGVMEIRPVLTPDREEKRQNGRRMKEPGEPMFTLTAQDRHGVAILSTKMPGQRETPKLDYELCPSLMANDFKEPRKVLIHRGRGFNEGGLHDIAPTITKKSYEHNNHLVQGYRIRKLTPRECWRLQGFPDWAFDRAKNAGVSDSQLYKQAGNSVTVNVIYEIAKRLGYEGDSDSQKT